MYLKEVSTFDLLAELDRRKKEELPEMVNKANKMLSEISALGPKHYVNDYKRTLELLELSKSGEVCYQDSCSDY